MTASGNIGISTKQAIDAVRAQEEQDLKKRHVPAALARMLIRPVPMRMSCDGPDCPATGKTTGHLQRGRWGGSGGWRHEEDMDFCPVCQKNGNMEIAIQIGVQQRQASQGFVPTTAKPQL